MTAITRRPATLSTWIAVAAGFLALVVTVPYSWIGLGVGVLGFVLLLVGVVRASHGRVTAGAAGLLGGAIAAGARGAPVLVTLIGVSAAVVAWDVASTGVTLGTQLGREADTARLETVHAGASLAVGLAAGGLAYVVWLGATGGQPLLALVAFLVAAVLLVEAIG